jgi:plastocyanin
MSVTTTSPRRERSPWLRRIGVGVIVLLVITLASTSTIWLRILRDGAGQPPVVGAPEIELSDSWFTPSVVEVPVGTTVRFHWNDGDTPHDVVFEDGIGSEVVTTGTYERTFNQTVDLTYRCTLHPGMNGRVIVTG